MWPDPKYVEVTCQNIFVCHCQQVSDIMRASRCGEDGMSLRIEQFVQCRRQDSGRV